MDKKYLASRIATASDVGLVVILYEGLIDKLKSGIVYIEKRDEEAFKKTLDKGKNILVELVVTLRGDSEFANNLRSIYIYINNLMTQGLLKREVKKLEEAIQILKPLYDGWKELEQNEFKENKRSSRPEIITGATYGKTNLNDYVINHENKWGRG
ncbi:MAG: flagellar export chaperone FliS [Marinisporobacter sp.]|jgi:flagellar protein FliS|nr:flagellar export chaperone FliS [Marinisporobacter sp.]